jgi:hypothetical protein
MLNGIAGVIDRRLAIVIGLVQVCHKRLSACSSSMSIYLVRCLDVSIVILAIDIVVYRV